MERLFVYGTLASGRVNHALLEELPGGWQAATLRGRLLDEGRGSEMGSPGIVPCEDGEAVEGFILASDRLAEYWQMPDQFEGGGYRRIPVIVRIESGEKLEAYVYALNRDA